MVELEFKPDKPSHAHFWPSAFCCWRVALKVTGITGTVGDRSGDIYYLLTTYGYTAPLLQIAPVHTPGQATVWLREDSPGLAYSLQARTSLTNDVWQNITPSALTVDTNAIWSAVFGFDPESVCGFFRVETTPVSGVSPPWPNGFTGP